MTVRRVPAALVAALALASLGASAAADDVAAIEARLRKLESENAALRRDLERLQQQPAKGRGGAAAAPAARSMLDALTIGDPRDLGTLAVGVLAFLFIYHTGTNFLRWVGCVAIAAVLSVWTVVRVSLRATRRAFAWATGIGEPAWLK